jgi:hypothetical protein
MPAEKVQFRPGPAQLATQIAARGGDTNVAASDLAVRDLGRYYDMLALALASVDLSAGQAGLLVDVLNGTVIDLTTAQMLAAEVEDSLPDGTAEKWDVDGPALVAKISAWNLGQRLAVCDAVERFWEVGHVDSTGERLVAVGLVRRG